MKTLLLLLALALPCSARLGETLEQCSTRYGVIVEKWQDGSWVKFSKGMVRVECTFEAGKCVVIEYQLSTPGAAMPQYDERFSEAARAQVLAANEGGSHYLPWKPELVVFQYNSDAFKTEDGKRQAYLSSTRMRFEVAEYIAARRAGILSEAVKEVMKSF